MKEVLHKISKELNSKYLNDICIESIFVLNFRFDYKEEYKKIEKYEKVFWNKERIEVTEEDADYFLSIYDESFNIHIKLFLSYLIASCYKRQNISCFSSLCNEYIEFYFSSLSIITNGLPLCNLRLILNWQLTLFPKNNEIIRKYICKILENKENKQSVYTFISLLEGEKIKQYVKEKDCNMYVDLILYHKDTHDANFIYKALNSLLNVFTRQNDNSLIKRSICDYILNNLDGFDDHVAHKAFNLVREYMGEFKYEDIYFEKLDSKLEEINKKMLEGLTSVSVELSEKEMNEYKEYCENLDSQFKKINNLDRVIKMLLFISPVEIESIKDDLNDEKGRIFGEVNKNVLRHDGSLVNYKNLDEKEEFSLHGGRYINFNIQIKMDLYYRAFLRSYVVDEDCITIKEIFTNNKLLCEENGDGEDFRELVLKFLKGDYDYTFTKLIIHLEKSLRYYLKNNGLNVKKYGKNEMIGLTGFFNYNKTNKFRDKLLETIDENYYFTLTWLLTDEYGMDYRGNIFHGLSDVNICKTTNAIYASILIIRLYLGFSNQ